MLKGSRYRPIIYLFCVVPVFYSVADLLTIVNIYNPLLVPSSVSVTTSSALNIALGTNEMFMHFVLFYVLVLGDLGQRSAAYKKERLFYSFALTFNAFCFILSSVDIYYNPVIGMGLIYFVWSLDLLLFCKVNSFISKIIKVEKRVVESSNLEPSKSGLIENGRREGHNRPSSGWSLPSIINPSVIIMECAQGRAQRD